MRDSIVFYRSFYEAIKEIPLEEQGVVYNAIYGYALDGIEPELNGIAKAIFLLVKPQIDANNTRYENGKKGGKAKGNQNVTETEPNSNQNVTEVEPKPNQDETETEPNVNVNENVNENDLKENTKRKDQPRRMNSISRISPNSPPRVSSRKTRQPSGALSSKSPGTRSTSKRGLTQLRVALQPWSPARLLKSWTSRGSLLMYWASF